MDLQNLQEEFDEKLKESVHEMVSKLDFNAIATPLKTDFQIKNELENKINNNLKASHLSENLENALVLIDDYLKVSESQEIREKVNREILQSIKHFQKVNKEFVSQSLDFETWISSKNKPTWTVLYGVSTETILLMYKPVLELVKVENYEGAKTILLLILFFAPDVSSYWNALGFCLQQQQNLDEAIHFYNISKEINPENLETYFYLARCYKQKEDLSSAFEELNQLKTELQKNVELKEDWKNSILELENFLQGS